jgi:RNA polymerase sigma-70 factor, ECF subfamily
VGVQRRKAEHPGYLGFLHDARSGRRRSGPKAGADARGEWIEARSVQTCGRAMDRLERFAQGDLDAFEELFREFQGAVYGWIVRIVRDPGVAEDLTLETFWRIYRARARFDPLSPFGGWARRIATNAALDHMRTARIEVELPRNLGQGPPGDPGIRRETCEGIERAFRRLPAKLQATAALALIEERPHEEIAQALGASVGAVKSRVFRAVRLLRKHLKQMGVEP